MYVQNAYRKAAGVLFRPFQEARCSEALAVLRPDGGAVTTDEIGTALALALLPRPAQHPGQIENLVLSGAKVDGVPGCHLELGADEAVRHPLFGPWVGATFDLAIANAVRAGTSLTQLAPKAPEYGLHCILDVEGEPAGAVATLTFPAAQLTVMTYYGGQDVLDENAMGLRGYAGGSLVHFGSMLRFDALARTMIDDLDEGARQEAMADIQQLVEAGDAQRYLQQARLLGDPETCRRAEEDVARRMDALSETLGAGGVLDALVALAGETGTVRLD